MVLGLTTSKSSPIQADYDALIGELAKLRKDMSKLSLSVGSTISKGRQTLAHDVSEGIGQATEYAGRTGRYISRNGHDADVQLEGAIANNPLIALTVAAGAGFLLAAMTWR